MSMEFELRIVVEKVAISTQEVVERNTLKTYDIEVPESILELGLRHTEQISLLSKVQNSVLAEQCKLIRKNEKTCPKCGSKLGRNGTTKSKFHAVFSDHQLTIQKHRCQNPDCRWQQSSTTNAVFGSNIHPDLAKLQCEQGANFSYRQAQENLEKLNTSHRSVNNHTQISRLTAQVGEMLSEQNLITPQPNECAEAAESIILQVDGGHIPIKEKQQRSFEALFAVAYRPENLQPVDNNHRSIVDKSCVISAREDNLETMKTYVLNSALKQGLNANTLITALADGAQNCWSVIQSLKPHCRQIEAILDWFHIGKKFQPLLNGLNETERESLENIKWKLWHGQANEAIERLEVLRSQITEQNHQQKLKGLKDYLQQNKQYLINYEQRQQSNQTFTSQVAESHIDSVINARHKRDGKMQWSRKGAHNVLQIRAAMASQQWQGNWQRAVLPALGVVA